MSGARFQRDKQSRALGRYFPRLKAPQSQHEACRPPMPAFANHDAIADKHRSHHRIGRGVSKPAPRQPQRQAHELDIACGSKMIEGVVQSLIVNAPEYEFI